MLYISIDLGSTNVKVVSYDEKMMPKSVYSKKVIYECDGSQVEFEPAKYYEDILELVRRTLADAEASENSEEGCCSRNAQIIVTGQAETIVFLDKSGRPLMNAVSWMDERAVLESGELAKRFEQHSAFEITGECAASPVWPAAKLLWMKYHKPEILNQVYKILMLKDYILFRLTGKMVGEYSTRGFTYFFDITKKTYWDEILEYCGVQKTQLPELIPAGSMVGSITEENKKVLGAWNIHVNAGALDHFAGAIGLNALRKGTVAESAGTVLSITAEIEEPDFEMNTSFHCGVFEKNYMAFSCCDNGGGCYEWFLRSFMKDTDYQEAERQLSRKPYNEKLLFLPYMTGTNAPDFEVQDKGMFYGVTTGADVIDFGNAVLESLAFLLKRNVEHFEKHGMIIDTIVSSGGGSLSSYLCQLKADVTGKIIEVQTEPEAVCKGAAIIGAVADGRYQSVDAAWKEIKTVRKQYLPKNTEKYEEKYKKFCRILERVKEWSECV